MSPYTAADGPPDLTATHLWTPVTGDPFTINTQGGTNPPTMPWVRLLGITGWRALPDSEDLREPSTLIAGGEVVYPSRILGKTVVYEMRVVANTVQSVQGTMTTLQRSFGNMSNEGEMTVTPLSSFGGGVVWGYAARVIDFDPAPSWEFFPHRYEKFTWGVALSLRMSDPHFYTGGVGYL